MNQRLYWKNYWEDKICGFHRSQDESFLAKEANEKLFHLNGGRSLLDFGCGSADLLAYYSQVYEKNVGIDASAQMLAKAKERLTDFRTSHKVLLLQSDDTQVWSRLEEQLNKEYTFNRITAGQVIQYLDQKQVEDFIGNAKKHISKDGLICFFDIVDSRIYDLWEAKLFKNESFNLKVLTRIALGHCKKIRNKLKKIPELQIGYTYSPSFFELLADKYKLKFQIVYSMYYEYRYHVIFSLHNEKMEG